MDTWVRYRHKPSLTSPVAVVGSPGLRSIGSLVVDTLIDTLNLKLTAELYSTHLPLIYQTVPSYASHPRRLGIGGVRVEAGRPDLPRVQFYTTATPPLIVTRGYHPNFKGQYEVAGATLDVLQALGATRVIVVAGYGTQGDDVCCAATDPSLLEELHRRHGLKVGYIGPFYGFSGLVFGLTKARGLEGLSLFARTKPRPKTPESPDEKAAKTLLAVLSPMLHLPVSGSPP
jgi:proteasome assembly chaperone (PAC2) family protein